MNERELIVEILLEIERNAVYSNVLIRDVLDKYDYLENRQKAFIKRVAEGTIERKIELDYILNQYSKVPVRKMKPFIRCLLRMSLYQILYMEQTADFAVCHQAVELAAKHKFQNLKGFVNGVLRNIVRNKDELKYPDKKESLTEYLSVKYSMPEFIVKLWQRQQGDEMTELLLKELLGVHPVTVRKRKPDFDIRKIEGAVAEQHPYLSYAYQLSKMDNIRSLEGFMDGAYTVQDVSSMLVCEAAGFSGTEKVLDVCAAPGGKALHAADMVPEGTVEARDVSLSKCEKILENADRLACPNIQVKEWDACVKNEESIGAFDVVLADVPCSGLGIMGKKRDIKYHVTEESLKEIVRLQRNIMDTIWDYVKPGGVLIYSTCTIRQEENENMVRYLTEKYPLEPESLDAFLPECIHSESTKKGYIQFLPGVHKSDGFFIARFRRKQEE